MSYQIEIRHLKYFLAVAENLNFRTAAESLFISQPGLSRQIQQMEEILDVNLFERNKKNVKLTAAGEYFEKEIRRILNDLESVETRVRFINTNVYGTLRVGFVGSAMHKIIPDLLKKLKDQFPGIQTNLDEMQNNDQVKGILNGFLDVGFVRLPSVPHGLKRKVILKDSFSVVLPLDHPMTESNFQSVMQLMNEEFILFSRDFSPYYYDSIMSLFDEQGFVPNISHKSIHAYTIFKLVETKLGIAIVPSSLKDGFDLRVKFIEIPNSKADAELSIIWKSKNSNPSLQNLLQLIGEDS